ncbi:hypothetical protein DL96DRAFT_214403 [Flagelloscypha sp. PMI_526]|nr:hypothetical protein DL96DRAFT_214403 [Flagelloscypha sp. PMI_526]
MDGGPFLSGAIPVSTFSFLMFAAALLAIALLPLGAIGADYKGHPIQSADIVKDDGSALQGRSSRIDGLLGFTKRQGSCPSGYGSCKGTDYCCPLGGRCCSSGISPCCRAGYNCYAIGCCRTSERACGDGCMPKGATCCGDYYCDPGHYCISGGYCSLGGGSSGGGNDDDETTTILSTSSTIRSTTSFSTSSFTSFSTSTATLPAPTRSPTGTSVSLTGPDIRWEGSWELTTSPCDISKQAKSCTGSGAPTTEYSMTYTITKGASVQLSIDSSDNCKYTISAGGVSQSYTGPQKNASQAGLNANCWFTYSASQKLSAGMQSWELSVKVEAPVSTLDTWWLQVNQMNLLEDPATAAATGLTSLTPSASAVSGASNEASIWTASTSSWYLSLFVPLMGMFL